METERGPDMRGSLRLEGQLVDEQRQAVPGARVWLDGESYVVSKDDGSFSFNDLAAGMYRVDAHKDDLYAEITLVTLREGREAVVLTMSRGMTLLLHVLDGESPIAGARVVMDDVVVGVSDAQGLAVVRGVGAQFQMVDVMADGYAPVHVSMWLAADPGGTIERTAVLARGAALGGVVLGPADAALAGAVVRIRSASWFGEATTDAVGVWRFETLVAGTYQVCAHSKIRGSSAETIIEFDGVGSREDTVIRVERRAELVGLISDESGGPVPAAFVVVTETHAEHKENRCVRADERGRFEILGLDAGEYEVFAHDEHRASPAMRVSLQQDASSHVDLVVEFAAISGVVVDSHGKPVAGVNVSAIAGSVRGDVTDRQGQFELGAFPRGDYDIDASWPHQHERAQGVVVCVTAGETNARLVLPSLTALTGRVLLDGNPMQYFGVLLTHCPQFPFIGRATGFHEADGHFTLPGVTPGTWGLVVAGPGTSLHTIADVVVEDGAASDLGDINLTRGQHITGRVRDAAGPVEGARVTIGHRDRDGNLDDDPLQQWFQSNFSTTTAADGTFAFNGVTSLRGPNARPSPISAMHPERGTSLTIAVPEGDATVDLTLLATGSIEGLIEGGVSEFASVQVQRKGEPADLRSARAERSGAFLMERLPEGEYVVTMIALPRKPVAPPVVVFVVANQRTRVVLVV